MTRKELARVFGELRTRLFSSEEAPARARSAEALEMTSETFDASLRATIAPWDELTAIARELADRPAPDRRVLLVLPANTPAPFLSALPMLLLGPAEALTIKCASRREAVVESWVLSHLELPVALEQWTGGGKEDEAAAQAHDLVVVYGGDATCARWWSLVGARAVLYADRFSVAFVASGADPEGAADAIARDAALWEGRGCLTPQAAIVEGDGVRATDFARRLERAMEGLAARLPPPPTPPAAAGEILSLRAAVALRPGSASRGDKDFRWTVLLDPRPLVSSAPLEGSPLRRTIWVRPVPAGVEVRTALGPLRARCEAVGGVDLPLGGMQSPSLRRRHGGREPLWAL